MIYKLVCAANNSFTKLYKKDDDEIIIAVDGGYNILKENNINVNYYFGDKDSISNLIIESEHIFEYNSIKDDSDFDLVIKYLINDIKITKDDLVYVYNATGGRLDHYQAIINTLTKYTDYKIFLFDENNCIYVSDYEMTITKKEYKYISFFSIEDNTIISLSGMKYNITSYNLNLRNNLCLSNEIIYEGNLKVSKKVLIIESK